MTNKIILSLGSWFYASGQYVEIKMLAIFMQIIGIILLCQATYLIFEGHKKNGKNNA